MGGVRASDCIYSVILSSSFVLLLRPVKYLCCIVIILMSQPLTSVSGKHTQEYPDYFRTSHALTVLQTTISSLVFSNANAHLHKSRWKHWSAWRNANVSCCWQPISTRRSVTVNFFFLPSASTHQLTFLGSPSCTLSEINGLQWVDVDGVRVSNSLVRESRENGELLDAEMRPGTNGCRMR